MGRKSGEIFAQPQIFSNNSGNLDMDERVGAFLSLGEIKRQHTRQTRKAGLHAWPIIGLVLALAMSIPTALYAGELDSPEELAGLAKVRKPWQPSSAMWSLKHAPSRSLAACAMVLIGAKMVCDSGDKNESHPPVG